MTNNQILLNEIINQEFKESNGFNNESTFFEYFSACQVLKDYELSSEEIENGIIGGGNDGGCDAAYLFLNNEIITPDQLGTLTCTKGSSLEFIIIQSKKTDKFKEDAIMKWKTVSQNLMDMSKDIANYEKRYCEGVRDMFMLFRDTITKLITKQPKIYIKFYYVTLGTEVHPNVKEQSEELKQVINNLYPNAIVSLSFVDSDMLMNLYSSEPDMSILVDLADQAITLGNTNEYVTLINIAEFYKFITDSSKQLRKGIFESNVRDYQGNNSVNSCIADTLRNKNKEDFWWFNNGITILSDKITLITSKKLSVDNPEIVNGLQTSNEIYNYFSENIERLKDEKRNVLVRFIVPTSEEVRDDIIFATNNQTNIPKSSLRVTDPIHLQIEMYCKSRGLYYDRRKNYYKNQKKNVSDIISVSFLAQCLISILLRKPDFARARPSTLLADEETYNKLYNNIKDLSVFYKVGKIGKVIQNNIRKTSDWTTAEKSDVLFYLIYGVMVQKLKKTKISDKDIMDLEIDDITDKDINDTKDIIYKRYKELGGNGRVAKSSTFVNEIDVLLGFAEGNI